MNDGVLNLGDGTYQVNRSLSASTEGKADWDSLHNAFNSSFAFHVKINKDYIGNILNWGNNILKLDITKALNNNSRLFSIKFLDQKSIKFHLPNSSEDIQTLSFTLRNGKGLSVYSDCQLLKFVSLLQQIEHPTGDQTEISIFEYLLTATVTIIYIVTFCYNKNFR